jgi:hypothetical protein
MWEGKDLGLGKLVCGGAAESCTANRTLDHLGSSIDRFANKAVVYLNGEFSEEAQIFGAFCARVTLENACAALVGRFDPFRMLNSKRRPASSMASLPNLALGGPGTFWLTINHRASCGIPRMISQK